MATYLVFEPQDGARTQQNAERVLFLRERFSVYAFVFGPLWLLWHKLWFGFLIWLTVFAAITLLGTWIGYGPYAALAAWYLPAVIFGLEGVNFRARKLMRNGYREAGVVIAEDLETAERRFFESWNNLALASAANPQPGYPNTKIAAASPEQDIIGMFPTPGQR